MKLNNKTFKFDFKIKQDTENESDFFEFSGYAANFNNIDRGNDKIIKGAFKDSIKNLKKRSVPVEGTEFEALMPILWQHQHDKPVGSFVEMKEDDRGLFVRGIMPKSSSFVRDEVIPQMKVRSISDMSIGYRIEERSIDSDDVWILEKLELFETSLVTIPMNQEANITAFKSVELDDAQMAERSEEIAEDAKERVKDHDGAFIGDVCIADMIDEKLTVYPSAVFKAAIAIQTGRGDYNDDDMANIKALYEKMGLEAPFEKKHLLGVNEAEVLTVRQLEKFLFASRAFSKEAAKKIVSKFKTVERDAGGESVRDAAQKEEEALKSVDSKIDEILKQLNKET